MKFQAEQFNLFNPTIAGKEKELLDILFTIDKYLKMPSLDGRTERQSLRKELREKLNNI